jgi:hypothetical protein
MHASLSLVLAMFASLASARQDPAASAPAAQAPAARVTSEALDASIQRATRWLRAQQREDGSFAPASSRDICKVAMTSMALWSLDELEPRGLESADAERAARFLLANHREDGGIYDPARGLAVYTSGVATRALRTLGKRDDWPELASTLANVELFVYRRAAPESIVDAQQAGASLAGQSREVAKGLLKDSKPADDPKRKALEFLARCDRDEARSPARVRAGESTRDPSDVVDFTYDDLLPFVYCDLSPEQQLALRARSALTNYYTPDRNPDLTKRYGAAGFMPGTQGLFYYYFVVAKTLTTFRERALVTADGVSHDWVDDIGSRLIRTQSSTGAWSNGEASWWEDEPVLATSYALLTLKLCRKTLEASAKR